MLAFQGIRVLDLTHILAGPFCTYQLALLGADVVKIEHPAHSDGARGRGSAPGLNAAGLGLNFQVQGSNKRGLALDLADPRGAAIFRRLAAGADVVVENYRSGALDALGLGAAALTALNPRLVHCSISGFGAEGDWADRNAYDNVIQASSGIMAATGSAPTKTGASIVDYATGLAAAFAIASALHARTVSGVGQRIDCAMLDTALMFMAPEIAAARYAGEADPMPKEAGLGCYATADGLLMLGAFNPRQNRRLWTLLGRDDFAAIDDWPGLWAAAETMRAALTPILAMRAAAEWERDLNAAGVPAQRVRALHEATDLPPVAQRGFLQPVEQTAGPPVTVPLAPFRFAADGPRLAGVPPRLGEHSDQVLTELGLPPEEIGLLRAAGVVA